MELDQVVDEYLRILMEFESVKITNTKAKYLLGGKLGYDQLKEGAKDLETFWNAMKVLFVEGKILIQNHDGDFVVYKTDPKTDKEYLYWTYWAHGLSLALGGKPIVFDIKLKPYLEGKLTGA